MRRQDESILIVRIELPAAALAGGLSLWPGFGDRPEALADGAPGCSLVERVEVAVAGGHERVVVDLGGLDAVSTDEVKALTDFLWTIRVAGGIPAVASPVPAVTDALRHLKLDRAFPVQESVAAAVADLRADPSG